ncbi:MAG: S8 family serine peptidase [Bacteroidales bacterium]|nr:S8 family serine peptidase [Bacteroidales bacterium]
MNKIILLISCCIFTLQGITQTAPHKYWIEFTDKKNNLYSLDKPEKFLSERALKRRITQSIPIDYYDLPITPMYLDSLRNMGLTILTSSKWMNGATIYTTDTSLLNQLSQVSFIKSIKKTFFDSTALKSTPRYQTDTTSIITKPENLLENYGYGYPQIAIHNGHLLHSMGFKGKGVVIAVIDAGFYNANRLTAFDSIWQTGRLLGTKDFVYGGAIRFNTSTHGTGVLSAIAAYVPGTFIGTAPEASFWLIRSEDSKTEYIIEEDNWVAAAEFADSVGVDIINTSLGYSTFDDASQNHTYQEMDGKSTRISRGAAIAAKKGMLIICSAGNQGNKTWRYITAPADADSILTIGAVDTSGTYANFSSVGPTADGRIKPDIAAVGYQTYVITIDGQCLPGNGTSFAAPIITGLAACLWQANPEASNIDIIAAIQRASNNYYHPDFYVGYGIPDFYAADTILKKTLSEIKKSSSVVKPNPFDDYFTIHVPDNKGAEFKVDILDLSGRKFFTKKTKPDLFNNIHIFGLDYLEDGIYIVNVDAPSYHEQIKIIKQ